MTLKPAPLEPSDIALPINLATALRLSNARPLIVTGAQAAAWTAEAQLQHAHVLWVPNFNLASDYIRHDGYGPDFNRGINTAARPLGQNVNFLYTGAGFTNITQSTDIIFEPLVRRRILNARRWDIETAKDDALFATAKAYFAVHQYRGQYAAALDVVERGHKLVDRIAHLTVDLVPKVEFDRAVRMEADMEQAAALARERWRVASANLTQILRLDPRVVLMPLEEDHLQVTLIDPSRPLEELIPIGLLHRPELASQHEIVEAVAQRIRREKGRILLPSLWLTGFQTPYELIQFGAQGIGQGSAMNLWSWRNDISPQVLWTAENLGMGNLARIKEQRGEQSLEIVKLFNIQDTVAAEITRAQARLQSAAVRVLEAERSAREGIINYDGNYEGLTQTSRFHNVLVEIFRPQEAVIALEHLLTSYNEYFATVAEYNQAQFEMFWALGYPAEELSKLNPPGQVHPVKTTRVPYMPEVDAGPPPATR
jgi:hypothetical protein